MQAFESRVARPIAKAQDKRAQGMSLAEHQRLIASGDDARTFLRLGKDVV